MLATWGTVEFRCYSFVGYSINQLLGVSLNEAACMHPSTIQHELLHAAGFYHEMMREDRDEYVRINWEHVPSLTTLKRELFQFLSTFYHARFEVHQRILFY